MMDQQEISIDLTDHADKPLTTCNNNSRKDQDSIDLTGQPQASVACDSSIRRGPYKCECGHILPKLSSLKSHWKVHETIRLHKCNDCGKNFSWLSSLEEHKKLHKLEFLHMCGVCDALFEKKFNLTLHMQYHSGQRPFLCNECDVAYVSFEQLQRHKLRHAENSFKMHRCSMPGCDRCFENKGELLRHIRWHLDKKSFKCIHCKCLLYDEASYQQHLKIHKNKPCYECEECEYTDNDEESFKLHLRNHSKRPKMMINGRRLFKCFECGYKVADEGTFQFHLKQLHKKQEDKNSNESDKSQAHYMDNKWPSGSEIKHAKHSIKKKLFYCIECGYKVLDESAFQLHLELHNKKEDDHSREPNN